MRTATNSPVVLALVLLLTIKVCTTHSAQGQKLQIETLEAGAGATAQTGDRILIHEQTRYRDGTLIFSSYQMDPLKVTLGAKQMIEGLDQGIVGMKIGELRKLIVPPSLSKRKFYPDSIHPDSVLVYEVRLVDIVNDP